MIEVVWEFFVRRDAVDRFEEAYGPRGNWAGLFHRFAGYRGTVLLRDVANTSRYVTIDSWETEEQRTGMLAASKLEYTQLDRECAELTESEAQLGVLVGSAQEKRNVKRMNPPTLPKPTGYTHVVEVSGGRTLYISGQIAVDQAGNIVGTGDMGAQIRQVFENLKSALAASGASFEHVVKFTIYSTDISAMSGYREIRDRYFTTDPPASTLVQVVRLVRPELMIEIEAVAVVASNKYGGRSE